MKRQTDRQGDEEVLKQKIYIYLNIYFLFTSSFFFYFSRRENMETRLLYLKESVHLTFICTSVAGGFSPGFNYIAWSTSALVPFYKYCSRADSFLTPAWLLSGQKCAITVDELSWKRCKYSVDATSREVGVEKEPLFFPFCPSRDLPLN